MAADAPLGDDMHMPPFGDDVAALSTDAAEEDSDLCWGGKSSWRTLWVSRENHQMPERFPMVAMAAVVEMATFCLLAWTPHAAAGPVVS
jgi:hypothetical protein